MRSTKKIAIIGSGQAGLLAAHGLLQQGCQVTLYSDKSAEECLHASRPTGTAARFQLALDYERELGLNHWEELAPKGKGVHLSFSPKDKNILVTLAGVLNDSYFQAVDLRLQCHRWMNDFEKQGGTLIIAGVNIEKLDAIAQENDLTLVAAGRGPLAELFPKNSERSVYDAPQRKLTMLIVTGASFEFKGIPFLPVKFNFLAKYGEAFWIPYYHRDHGACWCLLFEAKAGGKMDQFDDCKTGADAVERAKKVIKELIPYDYEWCKNMVLADEMGWLKGAVTPTVREPVGRLPSGALVMPVGDTLISMDPIGGQGANLGNKFVKHLVAAIAGQKDSFDENWMKATFDAFWANHGSPTVKFNNALLEPLTTAGKLMLISQYGSTGDSPKKNQQVANAIIENFRDPRTISDTFLDAKEAKKAISKLIGKSWRSIFFPALFRVIKAQLRQTLGLKAGHPLSKNTK